MTINQFDIELNAEATYVKQWIWTDPSTTLPIDLTGYTAIMQIRWQYGDPAVQLSLTQVSGIILGGTAGTVTLTITPVQTKNLSTTLFLTRGLYDLFLTDTSGLVTKFAGGFVYVDTAVSSVPGV